MEWLTLALGFLLGFIVGNWNTLLVQWILQKLADRRDRQFEGKS